VFFLIRFKMIVRQSFIVYTDALDVLDELTLEQAGKLLRAFRDFHSGNEPELDQITKIAFSQFKNQFLRDYENYTKYVAKQSANGSKSAGKKKTKATVSHRKPPLATVNDGRPPLTTVSQTEPPLATVGHRQPPSTYNDTVTDNDTDTVTENTEYQYVDFVAFLNGKTGRGFKGDTKSKRQFHARIKEGWTRTEFELAISNAVNDPYHKDTGYKYLTPEFLTRSDKLDRFAQPTGKQQAASGVPAPFKSSIPPEENVWYPPQPPGPRPSLHPEVARRMGITLPDNP
jgi:uncharacterized phage protein (TIGR02220 family)